MVYNCCVPLTYASSNFYRLLSKVEEKVLDFYRKGRIFEANAFHSISEEIVIEKLPVVGCCDDHKVLGRSDFFFFLKLDIPFD